MGICDQAADARDEDLLTGQHEAESGIRAGLSPPPSPVRLGCGSVSNPGRMMPVVEILGGGKMEDLIERELIVDSRGERVPAVLWRSASAGASGPLVLYGHGGTGHKRSAYVVEAAQRLVADHGWAVAAIDGPCHGERRLEEVADIDDTEAMWLSYQGYLARRCPEVVAEEMVADWQATLDVLLTEDDFRNSPVGYYGLSMGSRFGIPFVAAEPRVRAAVFGLAGTTAGAYMASAAGRVTVPVRFVANWDDTVFPLPGNLELFGALASSDKRMYVFPGAHGDLPPDELPRLAAFLDGQLTGTIQPA
jgi:dienelactone hydrolase